MKNITIILSTLFFANTIIPAQDLDKNFFNLSKVNKGDFLLCEKSPAIPPPNNKDTKLKIEPRPMPKGRVEETQNPVYTDEAGNIRRKSEDGNNDWYWSPNDGGFWWRPAKGPIQQGIPRSIIPAPTTPYCPPSK